MPPIDVIYIEDDLLEAQILSLALSRNNINVLHLSEINTETLTLMNTLRYQQANAVFIDANVNGASGIELAKHLRTQGDLRPIYLVTASANLNLQLLAELDVQYLQKPINLTKIAQQVHALA